MSKLVNPLNIKSCGGYLAALSVVAGKPSWMMIMPAGTFGARDGRGPWNSGDLKSMQAIVDRTLTHAGTTDLMIDYDHQSLSLDKTGGTAKAAGWIKRLEARADGIWAEVEWTDAARAKIEAKEYRYLSPGFTHAKNGDVALLLNVALVNMPALDLDAIAARQNLNTERETMDKILKALGLADGVSEEAVLAALNALTGERTKLITALGLKADVKADDIVTAITALQAQFGKVAEAIGLKAEAKGDEIVTAATNLRSATASGEPDPAKFVPIEVVKALRTDLDELKSSVTKASVETKVDEAMKAGKLIPAQREWALSLCASNPEAFDDFVGSALPLTATQLRAATPPETTTITKLSGEQKSVAKLLGVPEAQYLATLQAEANEGADN